MTKGQTLFIFKKFYYILIKIVKTATLKAQKEISGTKVKVNISNVQLDILFDIGLVNERTYIMFLF